MSSTVSHQSASGKAGETRRRLVAAARSLFGERGYVSTSVEEIVRVAGVTKGALYHHFSDKDDLFRSVVEDVKGDVTAVVGAAWRDAAAGPDALGSLVEACLAFIDAHQDPAVQRIAILDARAVLDVSTRRRLDARYEVAVIRGALRSVLRVGAIDPQPLEPLAHVIAGALAEGCTLLAEGGDDPVVRRDVRAVIRRLIEGLEPRTPGPSGHADRASGHP